jgi:tetratricopeptide (TPR) repeat protein
VELAHRYELPDEAPLLWRLGNAQLEAGDAKAAAECWHKGKAIAAETGQLDVESSCFSSLASVATAEEAPELHDRAIELARASGGDIEIGIAALELGIWHAEKDRYLPAKRALEEGLAAFRRKQIDGGAITCLEHLMWLEVRSFVHDEAVRYATELLEASDDLGKRSSALEARAIVRGRMCEHAEAARDFLEAADCETKRGDRQRAHRFRTEARAHGLARGLHQLPRWMFRPKDTSTAERARRPHFQPLVLWVPVLASSWFLGFFEAALGTHGPLSVALFGLAYAPVLAGAALFFWVVVEIGTQLRQRRGARPGCAADDKRA